MRVKANEYDLKAVVCISLQKIIEATNNQKVIERDNAEAIELIYKNLNSFKHRKK